MSSRIRHSAGTGPVIGLTLFLALAKSAAAVNLTTILLPNGGETLCVGAPYTISFSWSGADIEHVALYYRTDGAQPTHLDSSMIKHPINVPQQGTTWDWSPATGDIAETGRIWIDGHYNGHGSISTWDSSNADFAVRSCSAAAETGGRFVVVPAPTTQSIIIEDIATSSALVRWRTDSYSYTLLAYGTSTVAESSTAARAYPFRAAVDDLRSFRLEHALSLTGLKPQTTYYLRTISGRIAGEELAADEEYSFRTSALPDITPPQPVAYSSAYPGANSVLLFWINPPDPDFAEITVTRRADRFPEYPRDGNVILKSNLPYYDDGELKDGTTYFYSIWSADYSGNVSAPAYVTSTPDAGLPPIPAPPAETISTSTTNAEMMLRARMLSSEPAAESIRLSWKNPDDPRFLGVQVVKNEASLPAHPFDGKVIFRGRAEEATDTGLAPGQRYFYGIFPFNWKNQYGTGALISDSPAQAPPDETPAEFAPIPAVALRFGMRSDAVRALQEALAGLLGMDPKRLVTGYFGPLTRAAVQWFQNAHGIVSAGDETTTGFGLVGPRTRAKLNEFARKTPLRAGKQTHAVFIEEDGFHPQIFTIPAGDTVSWINRTKSQTEPASDDHPTHLKLPEFDPKRQFAPGETYPFTFEKKGGWGYHDHLYPERTGKVYVK